MTKRIKKSLLMSALICSLLIPAAGAVFACNIGLSDKYEFICDQTNIIGKCNEHGQIANPVRLYKNGSLCTEGYSLKIISGNQDNKIRIVGKDLVWDSLGKDNYFVTIAAVSDDGKKLGEQRLSLLIGSLILGPLHLNGSYDQNGSSDQYSLLDNLGKTIKGKIDWSLEKFSRNGTAIENFNSDLIKFNGDKIQWSSSLEFGMYKFKIVGTQNGIKQDADMTLNIENHYKIKEDKISAESSDSNNYAQYSLLENGKKVDSKNYKWVIKSLDKDNNSIKDINISSNGILSVDDFTDSSIAVAVVAQSAGDSTRELYRYIAHLNTFKCAIGCEGNSNNWSSYINKSGIKQLSFYKNNAIYSSKTIKWSLTCDAGVDKHIQIDVDGKVSWTKDLLPGQYRISVVATDKNNEKITATGLYLLDIVAYHFDIGSKENTFFCPADQEQGEITDFSINLVDSDNKTVDDKEIRISAQLQDKQSIFKSKKSIFSYNKEHHLEWHESLVPETYSVELSAQVRGRKFASRTVNIQAVKVEITGQKNISADSKNVTQSHYKLLFGDKELTNGGVIWSLIDNFDGKLNINSDGILTLKGLDTNVRYSTTIVASYKNREYKLPIEISSVGL